MLPENSTYFVYQFNELKDPLNYWYYHYAQKINTYKFKTYELVKLGDIQMGFAFSSNSYKPEGVSLLRIGDFNEDDNITFEDGTVYLPVHFLEEYPQFIVTKNDIIVALTGATIGKTAIYENDEPSMLNQRILRIRNKDNILNKFLLRAIQSDFVKLQILQVSSGGSQANIGIEQLESLRIPFIVDKRKQENIINQIKPIETEIKSIKSSAFNLQHEAINYLLQELIITVPENPNYFFKTGAEKQTLSFEVFPQEANERIHYLFFHPKYKALEELKSNYKTVTLESICIKPIIRGEQPIYDENGNNIVIKTVDIKNQFIDYENALKVNNEYFNSDKCVKINKGDILLASTGYVSMGKVNVYDSDEVATTDGHISIIVVNENYDPYFVAYYLRSHLGQIQIEKYFTGSSGQVELQSGDVNKFILPSYESIPKEKQTEIALAIKKKIEEAIILEQLANNKQDEARKLFENLVLKEIE